MEFHDRKPVTKHQAWFRKRMFDVPQADAHWLAEDTVQLWLVLGVSRDSSYAKRRDDPDAKVRTCIIDIDTVTAVSGDLRERAAKFIAEGDRVGELAEQVADLELDRLHNYLRAEWPTEIEGPDESPVDVAIRLLDRAVVPHQPTTAEEIDALPILELPDPPRVANNGPKVARFRPGNEEVQIPTGEVVGSIYRRGSTTRALLEEAFGDG